MAEKKLCPFCVAGITEPIEIVSANIPGGVNLGPQSRMCALEHFDCVVGEAACIAWDPSPVGEWGKEEMSVLVSHRAAVDGQVYITRRRPVSPEQVAAAGVELVPTEPPTSTHVRRWKFRQIKHG